MKICRNLLCVILATIVVADEVSCPPPVASLEETMTSVLTELRAKCEAGQEKTDAESIINDLFIPHVDVSLITNQVLGRQYWRESTEKDRELLVGRFKKLLAKQYAAAFNCQYLDNQMVFHPLRGEPKKYSRVESNITLDEQNDLRLRYAIRCDGEKWQVYDIVIDGLSLGQTYRSQFNAILKQGGIKGLIAYLDKQLIREEGDEAQA